MTVIVKNQQLFPRLIFKSHFDGFDPTELIPVCESLIATAMTARNSYLELGDAQSSVMYRGGAPHKQLAFKPFYDWLIPIVEEVMFSEWKLTPIIDYWISDSWVNRHGPGGRTDTHNHGSAAISVAAYITMPKNSGRIQFKDPNDLYWNFMFREIEQGTYYPLDVEAGDVVMFPGWLEHRTEPHQGEKEDRWVLTTNIMCTRSTISQTRPGTQSRYGTY